MRDRACLGDALLTPGTMQRGQCSVPISQRNKTHNGLFKTNYLAPATHCSSWSILRDLWGLDWPGSAPDPLSQWGRESQSRTGAGFWKASQGWLRIIIATWQQQREIQHVRSHPQTSRLQDLSMRDLGKGLKSARSFLIALRGQRT